MNRTAPVFACLLTLAVAAALFAPAASAQPLPAKLLSDVGIKQRLGESVPMHLKFTDQNGDSVALGDYFGEKPVILALVYYECPMLCTLVLNGMLRALRAMQFTAGSDFNVVTVSFDPDETPELARAKRAHYLKQYDRDVGPRGWDFLTGSQQSIAALTEAAGFSYAFDEATQEFAHASGIIVLTPQGVLSKYLLGVEYSARDLRLAILESSKEKIGSLVDQILLLCYHYDPQTGKYTLSIMNFMRLFGVATLAVLFGFIGFQLKKERSKQHL